MKILLKEEHVVCIQSLFHAPTENEEVSNYEPRDQCLCFSTEFC